MKNFQEKDKRITVFDNQGKGICDARNTGITHASASLYAVMDADDVAVSNRLQLQYEEFEKRPDLVLLGSNYHTFRKSLSNSKPVTLPLGDDEIRQSIRTTPTLAHPTIMARTECVRKVGGYRSAFEGAEDHDLYLRLSHLGELAVLPEFLIYYRLHSTQVSQTLKARGFMASVAAAFCDQCFREGRVDPHIGNQSCELIAHNQLEMLSSGKLPLTKENLILGIRAIRGLANLTGVVDQLIEIRRKIFFKLVVSLRIGSALKFWKSTRKRNWLANGHT